MKQVQLTENQVNKIITEVLILLVVNIYLAFSFFTTSVNS